MAKNISHTKVHNNDFESLMSDIAKVCRSNPTEGIRMATELYEKEKIGLGENILAYYYYVMGIAHEKINDLEKSFYYAEKAHINYRKRKDYQKLSQIKNLIGTYYAWKLDYHKAVGVFIESLTLAQEHQLQYEECKACNSLGIIFGELEQEKEAIKYFKKALELSTKAERVFLLSNLAAVYNNIYDFEQALEYLWEAYELRHTVELPIQVYVTCNLFTALGGLYRFGKALEILPEMEKLSSLLKDDSLSVYYASVIGIYLLCLEKPDSEVSQRLQSRINHTLISDKLKQIVQKLEDLSLQINIYRQLHLYYRHLGKWKLVCNYQSKLIVLHAQKYEKEKMQVIERLHIRHQVTQKEQKIRIQQLELEKKTIELEKKKELERINFQLEEKVAERTKKLTIQNQKLEEIAFIVSHDLREPLCNIHGISSLLINAYQDYLAEDLQELVFTIGEKAKNTNVLLKDILDHTILFDRKIVQKQV